MKKIKLIYNSSAGQSKFRYFLDTIIEKFMQNGIEVSVFRAGNKTNLYEYLKDADKEDLAVIQSVKVKEMSGEKGDSTEREVKLADKQRALELLGKHLGMFSNDINVSMKNAIQVELVDDVSE